MTLLILRRAPHGERHIHQNDTDPSDGQAEESGDVTRDCAQRDREDQRRDRQANLRAPAVALRHLPGASSHLCLIAALDDGLDLRRHGIDECGLDAASLLLTHGEHRFDVVAVDPLVRLLRTRAN